MSGDETISGGNKRALQKKAVGTRYFGKAKRRRFLDTLAVTCNVKAACRAAGVAPANAYRTRGRDPGFAASWQAALALGYVRLEEALLEYALSRVAAGAGEADEIDPGAVDPAAIEGSVAKAIADNTVSNADLQFAVSLLNRHKAAVDGRAALGRNARRAAPEETDAALRRKLDSLARRIGQS